MLKFISESDNRTKSGKRKAFYQCDCGNIDEYIITVVATNNRNMCKHCKSKENALKRAKNLKGKSFGQWLVLKQVENTTGIRGAIWECKCKCGNVSNIRSNDLLMGKSTKCLECAGIENVKRLKLNSIFKDNTRADTHRIYRIWKNMKSRCYGSHNTRYYKEQKVTICDEWKNDFNSFYEWAMKNGYSDKKELDKDMKCDEYEISPKIYSPETCIWIDKRINTKYSVLNDLVMKRELRNAYI